jgi:hypothetical protein
MGENVNHDWRWSRTQISQDKLQKIQKQKTKVKVEIKGSTSGKTWVQQNLQYFPVYGRRVKNSLRSLRRLRLRINRQNRGNFTCSEMEVVLSLFNWTLCASATKLVEAQVRRQFFVVLIFHVVDFIVFFSERCRNKI